MAYEDFKSVLDIHTGIIEQLIKTNDMHDWKQFVRGNRGVTPEMELQIKERYRKALANWAIFTYLTDTLNVNLARQSFLHLPYTYSNQDPFGTSDWKNSQATNLLETQKGNCYALVTLFKIFSERFKSEADIVTAPQHIYIEHRDPNGSRFNVEVATRSFPDMGSIQTLTYTTREALLNDISMRKLDLKQSIGLSLVYLSKGYEYKNKVKDDEFILTCANTALQHDPKNLNALLLKAQVYEQRVIKKQMPSALYEKMLAEFYKLGYRQMPDDMKEIILSKIQSTPSSTKPTAKTPNPFEDIGEQAKYVTLSNGLFEELHKPQKIVRYGQTIFDTEKAKIVRFLDVDNSSYQVDPVVFALSVDPLTKSYPMLTPYQFASNRPIDGIDLDGKEYESYMSGQIVKSKGVAALPIISYDHGWGPVVKASYDLKVKGNAESFNRLKEAYTTNPGIIHNPNNKLATYYPMENQSDKDNNLGVGDHMYIDIAGPFNDYVRFTEVNVNNNSFQIKAATLYGHTDAGTINFSGSFDPESGTINFSIQNETTNNIGMDASTLSLGRIAQETQWKTILNNSENYLGGKTESKTMTQEISIQNSKKGDAIKVVQENLLSGKKSEQYKPKK